MTFSRTTALVTAPDYKLMRRLNHWPAPRWVRWWMLGATRCGDGWLWGVILLSVLYFGDERRWTAFAGALLSIAVTIVLFRKIKHHVGRPRPCALEPHCWARLTPPDQFSFPSGHTMTAFSVAFSLGHFYPVLWPCLLFCGTSVAASRVLLGMHFLSDVVAGAALGAAVGHIAAWLLS